MEKNAISSVETLSLQEQQRRQTNLVRAACIVPIRLAEGGDTSFVYGGLESRSAQLTGNPATHLSSREVEAFMRRCVFGDIDENREREVLEALPLLSDGEIWERVQYLTTDQKHILGYLAGIVNGRALTKESLEKIRQSYQTSVNVDQALKHLKEVQRKAIAVPQYWNENNIEVVKNALYDYGSYASQMKSLREAARGQFAVDDSAESPDPLADRENFSPPVRINLSFPEVRSHVELRLKPDGIVSLGDVIKRNRQPGNHPKFKVVFAASSPAKGSKLYDNYEIDADGVITNECYGSERREVGVLDCSNKMILKMGATPSLYFFPKKEGQTLLDKNSSYQLPLPISDVKLIVEGETEVEEQATQVKEVEQVKPQVIARDVDSRSFDTASLRMVRDKLVCDQVVDFWAGAKDYSGDFTVKNGAELKSLPLRVVREGNLTFICQPGYEHLVKDIARWKDAVNHFNGSTLVPDENKKPVAVLLAGSRYVQRMATTFDGSALLLNGDDVKLGDITHHEVAHAYLGSCYSSDLTEGFALFIEKHAAKGSFDIRSLGGYAEMRALGRTNQSPGGSHTEAFEILLGKSAGEGHNELSYAYGIALVESLLWSGLCDYDKLVRVCRSAGDNIFFYRKVGDSVKLFRKTANGEKEASTREVNRYALEQNGIDPATAEGYLRLYNNKLHNRS